MWVVSELTGKIYLNGFEIPLDDSTPEFQQYLTDKANGVVITYVEYLEEELNEFNKPFVPPIVSQRQLRTQLVLNGFDLDSIQYVINQLPIPDKDIVQVTWDYAITFERSSPMLINLALALGIDENELDTIFINASKL